MAIVQNYPCYVRRCRSTNPCPGRRAGFDQRPARSPAWPTVRPMTDSNDRQSPLSPMWSRAFGTLLDDVEPVWRQAWDAARHHGQGNPDRPALDKVPTLWGPLQDAWRQNPDLGRRWAWEVGAHAWAPALKAVVDAGLITVQDLEKPRLGLFPLRLAERLESKHPSVFRWLVEQGEPADAPWGDGSRCLRDVIQAQPHKKLARLWLQRDDERTPERLRTWLVVQWEQQGGDDLRALLWAAWEQAMSTLPTVDRANHEQQAAIAWAQCLNDRQGWVATDQVMTDRMAQECWSRWKNELGDVFLIRWAHRLNARMNHPDPSTHPVISPAFATWFNEELRQAHQRHETQQLRATLDDHATPLTARDRLRL